MPIAISLIIPTYNASAYLPQLLQSLKRQTVSFELIIIDSSSTDNSVEIAREYTDNIIIIAQHTFDHGGTRTKAAKVAKGDILVYFTQDTQPYDEHTIENIVKIFEDKKIGGAYGRQLPYKDTNIFGKHLREFNYSDIPYIRSKDDIPTHGIKTAFLSDSFAAYRKSSLEDIGCFKNGLILGEDTYAGAKMILSGYYLAYVSDAKVYHSHSYTIIQEFKRYFDIGVFHKMEKWILTEFGKAEGEGMRYIRSEIRYLYSRKALSLLPEFILRNTMKYLGYKLGQQYTKTPLWIIKKLSMHKSWWKKQALKK